MRVKPRIQPTRGPNETTRQWAWRAVTVVMPASALGIVDSLINIATLGFIGSDLQLSWHFWRLETQYRREQRKHPDRWTSHSK